MKDSNTPIIAVTLVLVFLVASLFGWYVYQKMSEEDDINGDFSWQIVDREIKFPKDEGRHLEPYESWFIGGDLKDFNGQRYSLFTIYAKEDKIDKRYVTISALNDPTFERLHQVSEGTLEVTEGELDLTYSDGVITDTFMSTGMLEYNIKIDFGSSDGNPYYLHLNLTDEKKYPVLPFEEGTFNDWQIGSSYEYIQTRLSIFGFYRFGSEKGYIEGRGFIHHRWDFMARYPEDIHWLQFEDGRDAWIYKMYHPSGTSYILNTIIVNADGSYYQEPMWDFQSTIFGYTPHPDMVDVNAMATRWEIQHALMNLYLDIEAINKNQFLSVRWAGVVKFHGTIDGDEVRGRGFAFTDMNYFAKPYIEEISTAWKHDKDPLPLEYFTVRTYVYDRVPLDTVFLRYNVSYQVAPSDPAYSEVEMFIGDDGYYYGSILTPLPNHVVSFRVVATDILGVESSSDRYNEVIEYNY